MELIKLTLTNFRGIKSLEIDPCGSDLIIAGTNGTGKTTIADAYSWLLTGKNSQGETNFPIYPDGADDEIVCTVEGCFDDFVLTRSYSKVFTKKRGSSVSEFKGNKTEYLINGIPKKEKEWQEFISEKFGTEEQFKSLSDPLYFGTVLDPKKRRAALIEALAPEVGELKTAELHEDLHILLPYLDSMSVADLKAKTQRDRRLANEKMTSFPGRIDELQRIIDKDAPEDGCEGSTADLEAEADELNSRIINIQNGTEVAQLQRDLAQLQAKISQGEIDFSKEYVAEQNKKDEETMKLRKAAADAEQEYMRVKKLLLTVQQDKEETKTRLLVYREDYKTIKARRLEADANICPCCGQLLPAEKIDAIVRDFKESKAKELDQVERLGQESAEKYNACKEKEAELTESVEKAKKRWDKCKDAVEESYQIAFTKPNYRDSTEYKQLKEQEAELNNKINSLKSEMGEAIKTIQYRLADISETLKQRKQVEAQKTLKSETAERIEDLKTEEKKVGAYIAELDTILDACDKFVLYQASDIEANINCAFSVVKWKLFEQQINGGIKTVCEPLVEGLPMSNGINHANAIKGGFDIIRVLSGHWSKTLPIIIDNAESVVTFPETYAQLIELRVDGSKEKMEVSVND